MTLTFKLPHHPVAADETKYLAAVAAADNAAYRQKTCDYWQRALTRFSVIHTPGEPLVEEAHRAGPST